MNYLTGDLLSKQQYGFIPGRSTTTQLRHNLLRFRKGIRHGSASTVNHVVCSITPGVCKIFLFGLPTSRKTDRERATLRARELSLFFNNKNNCVNFESKVKFLQLK